MSMLSAMQKTLPNVRLSAMQRSVCVIALSLLMTACMSSRFDQAPVIDRSGTLGTQGSLQPAVPLGPPPPGYYRVKPGDTLYRIALENGQNYRDIAAWNNLVNPNQIEVGQLLRVAQGGGNAVTNALTPGVVTSPVGGMGTSAGSSGMATVPPVYGAGTTGTSGVSPASTVSGDTSAAAGGVTFAWPVQGPILGTFDDSKNKGLNIGGAAGDPVKASADGRVVYAGNGLRGYGNLIIIKHDATYLTAYAHNRALMVKEGDAVTRGQKIAEMGNSDSDRVMLHFEVRRQGKPVDPMKYLPPQ
ncbi:peptidoglycan DD-metalloendopeptidase family protein [Paraburkholderia hayleyella]|uniref:peptidoglycan DD-metalloendopeptidase family protein n=1 Tax=Paraburkholderia hayleyella TaxID=2152889 RepID=UPI001292681F|nr:peptidoglycan DD-metalloendopeptidase family protein [Paraburkholderia hayleyella]